jgi:CBS domain-containing protein
MSDVPVTLSPKQSVQDAMAVLYAHAITGAPVVNKDLQVVGVVSNHDFLWEEAFEGSLLPLEKQDSAEHLRAYATAARKICAQTVAEVMSDHEVVTVYPHTTMRHAAELMTKTKLHHLPVVDESNNRLVGILTSSDVMKDLLHIVRHLPAGNDKSPQGDGLDNLTP